VKKSRIGVYGGTFDPIHNGHLRVAGAIVDGFQLDRMLFVPAFAPPHKRKQAISAPFHRLAMLKLALAGQPRMAISTIELDAPERPYTIETLSRLEAEFGQAKLFFLMGADSFRDIRLWRAYERILGEYDCIVAARPGYSPDDDVHHLSRELQAKIVDLRGRPLPADNAATEPGAATYIYLTDAVAMEISATDLRRRAARGESVVAWTPPAVADYIRAHRLYQG
jgi:nicotinate-nucleotide adenylyltransferase